VEVKNEISVDVPIVSKEMVESPLVVQDFVDLLKALLWSYLVEQKTCRLLECEGVALDRRRIVGEVGDEGLVPVFKGR
jgi:hypothetical protein